MPRYTQWHVLRSANIEPYTVLHIYTTEKTHIGYITPSIIRSMTRAGISFIRFVVNKQGQTNCSRQAVRIKKRLSPQPRYAWAHESGAFSTYIQQLADCSTQQHRIPPVPFEWPNAHASWLWGRTVNPQPRLLSATATCLRTCRHRSFDPSTVSNAK